MVGLADLKRYTDNLKTCQIVINNKYCYFHLAGLTTFEFLDILNYKSWVYKTYQKNVTVRYINLIKKLEKGNAIVRTTVGFGPLLIRYLRGKGFQLRDQDIEPYRSRLVVFPDLKINLYDFQQRMVQDWLNVGGIGVVKSPTGSGKCPKKDTLILTNRGLIKIEDIVKKKEQTIIDDYFVEEKVEDGIEVISLKNSISGYKNFKILEKHDIGMEDLITVKTSLGLKISGTKEHPIIVMDQKGKLVFKQLQDINKEDYIAIVYNTQIFNEELEFNYHYRFDKYSSNEWRLENIKYMNEEIARLLGYIIAEANASIFKDKARNINITNYDKEIQEDIIKICKNLGIDATYKYDAEENYGNPVGVVINSMMFTDFVYSLGYKHLAQNKEVPWSILQANKKCQIEFIKALFDGDGTVYEGESKDMIELGSSSHELCRQVQLMLLNMGIIGRLDRKKGATIKYGDEFRTYEESYRLTLYGVEVLKFSELISFGLTRKREILERCAEKIGRWSDIVYPYLDEMFKILHEKLKEIGKKRIYKDGKLFSSSYEFLTHNSFNKEIWAYINGERLPGRSTLEKLLYLYSPIIDINNEKNKILKDYGMKEKIDKYSQIYNYIKSLYDNFIFDKVENISEERDLVYDITVEDVHSYIGNGIINHNTIIGCRAIKDIGRKSLILVHTSDLLINVWNDSLIKTFGSGIMSQVGIIGGGLTDSDRMAMKIGVRSGEFEENVKKDIVIATFQTLNNRLDALSQYKFGLMIVDECIPIDSEIWTKDGIVRYEDLGYGLEYKNDIFQVWSRDNGNNIVNNGYKKIKTRMKHMYRTIIETGDELVCSLDHKVLTRKEDRKEEFIEIEKAKNIARSLIRPYDMRKECILARIFGYVLGDGSVSLVEDRDSYQGSVSGDYRGLSRMANDIRKIDYPTGKISEIESDSIINTIKYGEKFVHSKVWVSKLNVYLTKKLVDLGHPIGKKTDISFKIPDWIMDGSIDIKKEFLGGYFGAEGSNPDFRGNENNKLRRSFCVNRFSISKRSDLVENGIFLASQIKKLLSEFHIEISDIKIIDSNIRKDGSISKQILSTISNNKDNLLRFLELGFRYCYEKEREGDIIRLYFKYISECDEERKEMDRLVIESFEKGNKSRKTVADKINKDRLFNFRNIEDAWENNDSILKTIKKKYLVHMTEGMVSDILYPHKSEKDGKDIIANQYRKVLPYEAWFKKVKGDLIFLDILRHEHRGYEQGYTLTVNKDHNYLVNGYVFGNCHHVPAQMFRKVNAAIRAPYKMGLSATMKRLDGLEKDVYGSLGDIQTSVTIRELINKGILAEPRFQSPVIVDRNAIEAIENCGHAGLIFSRFVKKTSASSKKKMDYVVNICKNVAARNRKFLLFTDYVHAEEVYVRDMYAEALLGEGIRVAIIDQGMSTEERSAVFGFLESGEISGIIFGKLGSEGVNIPSVDVVIMSNAIKSPITFTQRVGRVMRKVPGKEFCDVYEILLDVPTEYKWSDYNFAEYRMEGFQKLTYKVE